MLWVSERGGCWEIQVRGVARQGRLADWKLICLEIIGDKSLRA